jgi:NTP pyrophosphatase (non-canonical NTP hydrolase)
MIGKWDDKTFGNYPISKAKHMRKEVDELIEALEQNDLKNIMLELADVFILICGIIYQLNINLARIVTIKMKINKTRKWHAPDKDGIMEHIKENEDGKNLSTISF